MSSPDRVAATARGPDSRSPRSCCSASRPPCSRDFRLSLLGKFLCFAIVAVGIGLAWGRGGMLTLGQGVFFGLGAYIMAMHLKIADAELRGDDCAGLHADRGNARTARVLGTFRLSPGDDLGDPLHSDRDRRGASASACSSVASRALTSRSCRRRSPRRSRFCWSASRPSAAATASTGSARSSGSTSTIRPTSRCCSSSPPACCSSSVAVMRQLMNSRYGELLVAVRDQEERVRFLGYDPANIKLVAYVVAAFFAGIAGALFVPIVGHHLPRRRRDRPVDRVPDRGGDRRTHHAARSGARCDRRRVGADAFSERFPSGVDLRPGSVVHRRRRVLPGRCRRAVRVPEAPTEEGRRRPDPDPDPKTETETANSGVCPHDSPDETETARATMEPTAGGNAGMSASTSKSGTYRSASTGSRPSTTSTSPCMQGDLRFLIGPNGAGKTTLVDAITGLVPATGSITKSGVELLGKKVHQIARLGVGARSRPRASSRSSRCCRTSTSRPAPAGPAWTLLKRRRRGAPRDRGGTGDHRPGSSATSPAGILAHGQKQWLEIGMLLVQNADVLLLDEPVAGMSDEERDETGNLLRRIGGERTVVVVEHDMDFMRAFATSVTVLARGQGARRGNRGARCRPTRRCRRSTSGPPRPVPTAFPTELVEGGLRHARARSTSAPATAAPK